MLEQLLQCALEELDQNRSAVLAVIAEAQGSTPRDIGAAMLVGRGKVLAGTIGGGEIEYQCTRMAEQPQRPLMEFFMNNQQAAVQGMICGGRAKVLFIPMTDRELIERSLERLQLQQTGWLQLPLDGGIPVLITAGDDSTGPEIIEKDERFWLSLPLLERGRIFLMGGGHVSLALSKLLDLLGYSYIVVDDREEFAAPQRFPHARQTVTGPFSELSDILTGELKPGAQDCICIMTRGHLADADALRFALTTPAGYIGLMGSRRKREQVFAMLAQEGFSDGPKRVTTPIGLPIGGQTPEEIAVSIAAQLVEFRCSK